MHIDSKYNLINFMILSVYVIRYYCVSLDKYFIRSSLRKNIFPLSASLSFCAELRPPKLFPIFFGMSIVLDMAHLMLRKSFWLNFFNIN